MPKAEAEDELTVTAAVSSDMDSPTVCQQKTHTHTFPAICTDTHGQTASFICLFVQQALIQDIDGTPVPSVTIQVSFLSSRHMSCFLLPFLRLLSVSLQVKVKSSCVIQSSKLTVSVQPPLAVTQDQFVLEPMGKCDASL